MAEKLYYSMGEVAEMFDVNQSLIRHWESQFSVLRPKRNKKGNRLFTPQDVENLKRIYHLVKECGMTLEGAKRAMRRQPAGDAADRSGELLERLQPRGPEGRRRRDRGGGRRLRGRIPGGNARVRTGFRGTTRGGREPRARYPARRICG